MAVLLPSTTIFVLLLEVAWASHQCSWDPSEAVLQCSISWQKSHPTTLAFSKHQREATSTLQIFCTENENDDHVQEAEKRKRLSVDYDSDRRQRQRDNNLWPHLKSLHVNPPQPKVMFTYANTVRLWMCIVSSSQHREVLNMVNTNVVMLGSMY